MEIYIQKYNITIYDSYTYDLDNIFNKMDEWISGYYIILFY